MAPLKGWKYDKMKQKEHDIFGISMVFFDTYLLHSILLDSNRKKWKAHQEIFERSHKTSVVLHMMG